VDAVRSIALSDRWELSSVREAGDSGLDDVHWITKFADDGGQAILTADTDLLKRHPQVMAVFSTGVKVIHMPAKWQNAEGRLQAAHVLLWWRRIEETLQSMKGRECYRPPWNLTETGKMVKVPIDFQNATKKLKKKKRKKRQS